MVAEGILVLVLILDLTLAAAGNALENVHAARLEQLEEEQTPGARLAARLASRATNLVLGLRLALSGLRLAGVAAALAAWLGRTVGTAVGPTFLGLLGVLVSAWTLFGVLEFLAQNFVLRDATRWALRLAPLAALFMLLVAPLVWLLVRLGAWVSRSAGGPRYPMVTEEEIMTLVSVGEEGGVIEEDEKAMIYSIFQLSDTLAREVMVPRIDILAFEADTSLLEATDRLLATGYSRAPVYRETIDNVIGVLYVKDLLAAWRQGVQGRTAAELVREPYFVPEAKRIDELLAEMQARHIQMAIVVDEYGGTAGLVTFEDIVEEIVGEIRDEYDFAEELPYQMVSEEEYVFRGGIDLDDVNELLGAELPTDTSETLAGFIYSHLGRVPAPGERLQAGGLELTVEQVTGRRIRKVRARKLPQAEPDVEVAKDEADSGAKD